MSEHSKNPARPEAGLGLRVDEGPRGPGSRFLREQVRPRDIKRTLWRLLQFAGKQRKQILGILLLGMGVSLASLAVPLLVGRTIDELSRGTITIPLSLLPALVAVYLFDALASHFQAWILSRLSQILVLDLRMALFKKIIRLPLARYSRYQQGDLMSRMNNDADEVAQAISQNGSQIVGLAVNICGSILCMLILSPVLTLAAMAVVPLMFLLTSIVSKKTRRWFREQQAALGRLNAHMEESVNGFTEVLAFERQEYMNLQFDQINRQHRRSSIFAQLWAGLVMPMMNVFNNISFALIAGVGGFFVLRGGMSPGTIAAFIGYSRQFGRPINELASTWSSFQAAIAGAERIFDILDEEGEERDKEGALPILQPRGEIQFQKLSFSYIEGTRVLDGIDLKVPAGTTIALVGPTGSGKTSIISLLLRFYEPDSGRILFDGRPLDAWTRSSLRSCFALVPQDCWLSDGSIADIISYGRPNASMEEIMEAARNANAHDFIIRLPKGYNTIPGQGGRSLSEGQRQLLAIARAIIADTPCLILDEATSNIDTRTELHVQEALLRLMKGRSCFIVAHRLSTILKADAIALIDSGRILEYGSHQELLNLGGRYSELCRAGRLDIEA